MTSRYNLYDTSLLDNELINSDSENDYENDNDNLYEREYNKQNGGLPSGLNRALGIERKTLLPTSKSTGSTLRKIGNYSFTRTSGKTLNLSSISNIYDGLYMGDSPNCMLLVTKNTLEFLINVNTFIMNSIIFPSMEEQTTLLTNYTSNVGKYITDLKNLQKTQTFADPNFKLTSLYSSYNKLIPVIQQIPKANSEILKKVKNKKEIILYNIRTRGEGDASLKPLVLNDDMAYPTENLDTIPIPPIPLKTIDAKKIEQDNNIEQIINILKHQTPKGYKLKTRTVDGKKVKTSDSEKTVFKKIKSANVSNIKSMVDNTQNVLQCIYIGQGKVKNALIQKISFALKPARVFIAYQNEKNKVNTKVVYLKDVCSLDEINTPAQQGQGEGEVEHD